MARIVGLARLLSTLAILTSSSAADAACTISQGAVGTVVNGTDAVCDGPNACDGATIDGCDDVKCTGTRSCASATIRSVTDLGSVLCDGVDACDKATINAAENSSIVVECDGQTSCSEADVNAGDGGLAVCRDGSGAAAACRSSKIAARCLRCVDVGCGGGCLFTELPAGTSESECRDNDQQGDCDNLPPVATPAPTPSVPEPQCTASQPSVVDDDTIRCNTKYQCQNIVIDNCRNVECMGIQSCKGATILNVKTRGHVKCGGASSCGGSIVHNAVGSSFSALCSGEGACEDAVIHAGSAGIVECNYGSTSGDAACKDATIFSRCLECASKGGCGGECFFTEEPDGSAKACVGGTAQGDCSGGTAAPKASSFVVNVLTYAAPAVAFLILGM